MKFKEHFQIILEKDLRPVFIKRGLPQEEADWCHSMSEKFSGFVANAAFFHNIEYNSPDKEDQEEYLKTKQYKVLTGQIRQVIRNLFNNQDKPILPKKPNDMNMREAIIAIEELSYIKDYYNNPLSGNTTKMQTVTWAAAKQKADEFHEEQAKKEGGEKLEIQNGQKVVHKFPDGFYWLNLNTSTCRAEANAMGHCGSSEGILYSLRDRTGVPYITAALDATEHKAIQIYGRANTTPRERYHRKILTLLGELEIERVGVKHYGEKSLDVENDISDEDKKWFEETYNYYPSNGGISEKEYTEAEESVTEINEELQVSSISIYDNRNDEYSTLQLEFYLELGISRQTIYT
mgnify:CR=1 FL=1